MEFFLPIPATTVINALGFIIPFIILIYSYCKSRKSTNKKAPPEVGGAWPFIGHLHLLAGSQPPYKTLGNLADKYGPIFTIKLGMHRALVVSSSEMVKQCLNINDKAFAGRPKSVAGEILGYNDCMLAFCPYGSDWREIRKIMSLELLSHNRLEMLKHVPETEVKAAIQGLYQKWIKNEKLVVEMKKWFWHITLNVMLKIIVGKRYSDSGEDEHEWSDSIRDSFVLAGKFPVSDAIPFLRWLDLGGIEKEMKRAAKELDRVADGWLQEHKQKKDSGMAKGDEDFMYVMLSILDDAKEIFSFSADTVNKATCLSLVFAGSDTTQVALTWTLSLLLNHPHVLKKVYQELDIQVGRERQVKESDMKNLVYLHAVIKETFRLYPPAPLMVPHESMEDCTVDGYHIPAGTKLFVNIPKIQHNPLVWPDPHEFQPERFLTTHKNVDVRGQNFELIPFGSGRRMCPGISFVFQDMNLVLASLLHGFEVETATGKPIDMTESSGVTNLKATPLEVVLTPRLPAQLYT